LMLSLRLSIGFQILRRFIPQGCSEAETTLLFRQEAGGAAAPYV
jgi:hypothetical protein